MVEQATIEKLNAAISAAISEALTEKPKAPEPAPVVPQAAPAAQTPATPAPNAHSWDTEADGSLFCKHCKGKALPISIDPEKGPEELLNAMQNTYHKKTKDWLACPECRSTFSGAMDRMGYQTEIHKDGRIEIEKK